MQALTELANRRPSCGAVADGGVVAVDGGTTGGGGANGGRADGGVQDAGIQHSALTLVTPEESVGDLVLQEEASR